MGVGRVTYVSTYTFAKGEGRGKTVGEWQLRKTGDIYELADPGKRSGNGTRPSAFGILSSDRQSVLGYFRAEPGFSR